MSDMIYTVSDEEELTKMKERTTKIKLILLDKMGKHPLTNPKYLKEREKVKLLLSMKDYLDTKSDDEIDAEFNEICLDKLFDCNTDITSYPIYDLSEKNEVVDIAGNSVPIREVPTAVEGFDPVPVVPVPVPVPVPVQTSDIPEGYRLNARGMLVPI